MKKPFTKSLLVLLLSLSYNSFAQWKPVESLEGGISKYICRDGGNIYMMVDNFGIVKSIDSGTTWNRILEHNIPYWGTFSYMSTDNNLLAVDSLISTDAGQTWQTLNLPLNSKNSFPFFEVYNGKIYFINNKQIAISDDNGLTWKKHKLPENSRNRLLKSNGNLYLLSYNYIYSTTNEGISWDSLCAYPGQGPYPIEGIIIMGDTLICEQAYSAYLSTDHGVNWTPLNNGKIWCDSYFENDTIYVPINDSVFYSVDLGNTLHFIAAYNNLGSTGIVKIGQSIVSASFILGACKIDINTGQVTENAKGIYALPIAIISNSHDSIFVLSNINRLYYSYNNGITWSHFDLPIVNYYYHMLKCYNNSLYLHLFISQNLYKIDLPNFNISLLGTYPCEDFLIDTSGIYSYGNNNLNWSPLAGGQSILLSTQVENAYILNNQIFAGESNGNVKVSPIQPILNWTYINNGLNFSQNFWPRFSGNRKHVYLYTQREVYRFEQSNLIWNATNLKKKSIYCMAGYGDAMFVSTSKYGIKVLGDDTSTWQSINKGLPKCNYDTNHVYGFDKLICTDSTIFASTRYSPDIGLWYRPLKQILPLITAQQELQNEATDFDVYPNPVNDFLFSVSYKLETNFTGYLDIVDLLGNSVFKMQLPKNSTSCNVQIPKLAQGIYQCVITSGQKRMSKKISIM